MPAHCGGTYGLVEIRQSQKFLFVPFLTWILICSLSCTATLALLPCRLAYIHVNISFISTGIFICVSLLIIFLYWEVRHCWHFWSYLTMHHFSSSHAQWAFPFPRVSIHFLCDQPAWGKRPKPALTSDLGLNSVKHQNCPFTAKAPHWVQVSRDWGWAQTFPGKGRSSREEQTTIPHSSALLGG